MAVCSQSEKSIIIIITIILVVLHIFQSQDEDSQMMTEVDLFISTKAVKVLNADTQVGQSGDIYTLTIVKQDTNIKSDGSFFYIGDNDGQCPAYHLLYC